MIRRLSIFSLLALLAMSSVPSSPGWTAENEGITLETENKRMNLLRKADKASQRGKYDLALGFLKQAFKLTPIPDINDVLRE